MTKILRYIFLIALALSMARCEQLLEALQDSGDNSESGSNTISGTATYELPTYTDTQGIGLNLGNPTISVKPIRQARVEIVSGDGLIKGVGNTDDSGNYSVTYETDNVLSVKVRVVAGADANSLNSNYKAGTNTLVRVVDNTNGGAEWAAVSSQIDVSVTKSHTKDMHASVTNSASGPFAILDAAINAYNTIKATDSSITFTTLPINWSPNNSNTGGNLAAGQIGTSFWNGSALYILGQANVDADEYDIPVVGHEFGHYVESTLFRSDSIGGSHAGGNDLDLRVAFGEGFGNAFGSIVRNDPIYFDTTGTNMTILAFNPALNLENGATTGTASAANETSVQKILWDIYDTNADANDNLSLGFGPIFTALRTGQKNSTALTTLISFSAALNSGGNNPSQILSNEFNGNTTSVNVVGMDHFAQGGTANLLNPNETCRTTAYTIIGGNTVGATADSINFTTPGGGSGFNKYCSTMYYKYSPTTTTSRTFAITAAAGCDLDIYLYSTGTVVAAANQAGEGSGESFSYTVSNGTVYVWEVRGWSRNGAAANSASGGPCNYNYSIN